MQTKDRQKKPQKKLTHTNPQVRDMIDLPMKLHRHFNLSSDLVQ